MARHVAYFLREPRLGAVKRRLGAEIGDLAAWQFYRRTVRRVLPLCVRACVCVWCVCVCACVCA